MEGLVLLTLILNRSPPPILQLCLISPRRLELVVEEQVRIEVVDRTKPSIKEVGEIFRLNSDVVC